MADRRSPASHREPSQSCVQTMSAKRRSAPPVPAGTHTSQCQASFIKIKLQWGGGGFSRVGGSKALDPPPRRIIPRVSWVGLLPPLLSLVTGALAGCLLVPLSALLLCKHHAIVSLWLWGIRWIL